MAYFTKRYHAPGTSPGTLQPAARLERVPLRILLVDYTDTEYDEREISSADECRGRLARDSITWIHVQGDAEPETMHQLGELFGLHHLALEDVINSGQRPKVDEYPEQLFIAMAHPVLDRDTANIRVDQLSLFLGRNYVVSFHPGEHDPFEVVRQRLRDSVGRIRRRGADYLLYALIDLAIDSGFPVLEWLGDEIERLEDEQLATPTSEGLRRLHHLKRTLVILRRTLWPQREVAGSLLRADSLLIADENKIYYSDCFDHTVQIMDLVETYRDMLTGLLDVYLSSVSYRLNEIMRVLTVIATIFIPLTFITGIYGMNFVNASSPWAMPELRWYYGYPLALLLMAVIAAGMLVYFRLRKWL